MLFSRSLTLAVPIAVFACGLLAGGCDRESGDGAQPRADAAGKSAAVSGKLDRTQADKPLPAITLGDAAGSRLELRSLAGKPVLLNLWATWCAPCVVELPTLNALANRADLDLQVVTVSQDTGDAGKVQAFLDQRGLAQLPAWLDPQAELTFELGATDLPTTILYGADGREIWRYTGDNDWTSEAAMALIAESGATGGN